jgi:hypothetical protein
MEKEYRNETDFKGWLQTWGNQQTQVTSHFFAPIHYTVTHHFLRLLIIHIY